MIHIATYLQAIENDFDRDLLKWNRFESIFENHEFSIF